MAAGEVILSCEAVGPVTQEARVSGVDASTAGMAFERRNSKRKPGRRAWCVEETQDGGEDSHNCLYTCVFVSYLTENPCVSSFHSTTEA